MIKLKSIPLYPILFSLYPVFALAAANRREIDTAVILRPTLVSLLTSVSLYLAIRWLLKSWPKAAALTTFFLVLFFSYGHVYQFLERKQILGMSLGRHRILIVVYALILTMGVWGLLAKGKDLAPLNRALNLACIFLLVMPLSQFTSYAILSAKNVQASADAAEMPVILKPEDPDALPDVYFIVLDTYTRSDALLNDFNYDNSAFLDGMRQMGFFVADCSRSNYAYTQGTITAALNLDYLPELTPRLEQLGLAPSDIWIFLKQSLVRQQLEAIGYRTVAFETGYEWSRLADADTYLGIANDSMALQQLNPFEAMFIKTTALLILTDSQSKLLATQFYDVNFPHNDHIDRQRFILDQLPRVASLPGAKFVFVHLLIPHVPYVFGPDGEIRTDSAFFAGESAAPLDEQHLIEGYTGEVEYLNMQLLPIFQEILDTSAMPPIIIVMGDHGLREENRLQILNAYYLPGNGADRLYSNISPVNSFRVVFDTNFGTDYGLLPDQSYGGAGGDQLFPETSPQCMTP